MNNLLPNKRNIGFTLYSGADGGSGKMDCTKLDTTADKLYCIYLKTGSKKTYSQWLSDLKKSQGKSETPIIDWLQSDSAKKALSTAQTLVDTIKGGNTGGGGSVNDSPSITNDGAGDSDKNEFTILGFHPFTFAIGATAILVVGYFGGKLLINKLSKK